MQPLVELHIVEAVPPSLKDNTGDLDRLKKALSCENVRVPNRRIATVAGKFRQAGFRGAAVINVLPGGRELVDFLPEVPPQLVGMALDLGTTHLEACLVDMLTGVVLARGTIENAQIEYGADILARIHFAAKNNGLAVLHDAIITCINELADELAVKIGFAGTDIRAMSVSGNTTMTHFLLGLDPYHLCREPYIPVVNIPEPCMAEELGLKINPASPIWVLPSIGSYFGGDLISGIIASGLDEQEHTSMLIDVGTNAEVVVGNREWLIACAGAAGPALEGGVAKMGMRAGPGAIDQVSIDKDTKEFRYRTIGDLPPKGICGSGIIDLVAELYLSRMIDLRGKFRIDAAGDRLIKQGDGFSLIVAAAEDSADGKPITLSQVDLDALMRSKAAMYSILRTLTNQVGTGFDQLRHIYVAGAFGQHISPRQAIVLGMIPDLPLEVYVPIGNSSLAGAKKILLEEGARSRSVELVKKITYVELNVNQEFMIRFSGARFIPHTDHNLFPSVPFFEDN
ncbi:MAG: DUF4445 domain-containing protein [Proteobacteria bacterium]|nr:DUF4445 domain-containing protein [Pseudomonadota bacterium]MBU1715446.1 DUF4445 domain-containing protein [Pseudomonadota bacterium]